VLTAVLSAIYIAVMFLVVRPFLRRLQTVHDRQGRLSQNVVALILLLVLASAWTTERIGIHALFGAFVMGAVMPKGTQFVRTLAEKLEDFIVVFLLPIFFAYTGLKTQIGLLNNADMWFFTLLVVAAACLGKFGGSAAAARACGLGWRESATIGILMNTRGLMELVILNVGRELGVITPAVFAMMVIMALVTTALTTPVLHVVSPPELRALQLGPSPRRKRAGVFSILLPVADPRTGGPLLRLAELIGGPPAARMIYALHLTRPREQDAYLAGSETARDASSADSRAISGAIPEPLSAEASLQPLLEHAREAGVAVEPITLSARDVPEAIEAVVRQRQADLVLMGSHRAVLGKALLGGTVHRVLSTVPADVGIFVDRGFTTAGRVLVPYLGGPHDRLALDLASRLGRHGGAEVTVLHVTSKDRAAARPPSAAGEVQRVFRDPSQPVPVQFRVIEADDPVEAVVRAAAGFDLMVVAAAEEWGTESHRFGFHTERIAEGSTCSLLLVHRSSEAGERPVSGQAGDESGISAVRGATPPVGAVPAATARDGVKSAT
jgi:nucleotide-binding universal stress UspA family protein